MRFSLPSASVRRSLYTIVWAMTTHMARCTRDRGGWAKQRFMAPSAASRSGRATKLGIALDSLYGPVGRQICGQYAADFAANGSDEKACSRWPVVNLCSDSTGLCAGGLGMQRCDMPQIPSPSGKRKEDFKNWKSAEATQAIYIRETNVTIADVAKLLPSQDFVNMCEVCSIAYSGGICFTDETLLAQSCKKSTNQGCFCFWQSGISVSQDGYVLDGHHRWAAAKIMMADRILPPNLTSVTEAYSSRAGQPKASIMRILETAKKHPELVEHTKCSSEEVG